MGDNIGLMQLNEAQALIQPLETDGYYEKIGLRASGNAASTKTDGFIALIESRSFIRECIRRSMQSAFPLQIQTFSETVELQQKCHNLPNLILLSAIEGSKETGTNDFKILSQIAPGIPIIVLACDNDAQMAKAAIRHGAKGYIPVTLGFDIAIEAVRFVLAGGLMCRSTTYSRELGGRTCRLRRRQHRVRSRPVNLQSSERSSRASQIKS